MFRALAPLTDSITEPERTHCDAKFKRLERGSFEMPRASGTAQRLELDATELAMLLGGVSLASAKRRKRYRVAS